MYARMYRKMLGLYVSSRSEVDTDDVILKC